MEDALVLHVITPCGVVFDSLNPCFNGRCTRTYLLMDGMLKNS